MEKFSLAIIDKNENNINEFIGTFKDSLNMNSAKVSNNINDLTVLIGNKRPSIILIGPTFTIDDFEDILRENEGNLNHIKIILLSNDLNAALLKRALKIDIHDVIEYPFDIKDFIDSVKRAKDSFKTGTVAGDNQKDDSKKILFLSTKGGSGNTFLSSNYALALRNLTKKEVVLYDLNYELGDAALVLGVYPKHTIYDLVNINKYDPETLDIFLSKHESGLKLLPSPIDPSQAEAIDTDKSLKILKSLNSLSDYIIIDAPVGFNDLTLSFLDNIDHLFIVSTKDLLSIKNLKIYLQVLKKLNFDEKKISIVLNRADSKVEFDTHEIEKTINRKVNLSIPSDRVVPISINKGTPPVINYPRSAISKSIIKLVKISANERVNAKTK